MPREFKRTDRVAEGITRELAKLIQYEVKDPNLPKFVSVSGVEVTRDLAYAKVYISVLGRVDEADDSAQAKLATDILNKAAGYLRSRLAKEMLLRNTPELRFIYDSSVQDGNRLAKLIDDNN